MPTHESDNESVKIDDVTDQSAKPDDLSPLQAQREWISQAEENVLDRLVQAGLLAAPSDFDKILEQVTNNIIIGNNIQLASPVHCRVMLTTPLESHRGRQHHHPEQGPGGHAAFGSSPWPPCSPSSWRTSCSVTTSIPNTHSTTASSSLMNRPSNASRCITPMRTISRLRRRQSFCSTSPSTRTRCPKRASYFAQLQQREKELSALNTPRLGDSLLDSTGQPWMIAIQKRAPKLDQDKLDQIAALPLGSRLRTDAWDDKVYTLEDLQPPYY